MSCDQCLGLLDLLVDFVELILNDRPIIDLLGILHFQHTVSDAVPSSVFLGLDFSHFVL